MNTIPLSVLCTEASLLVSMGKQQTECVFGGYRRYSHLNSIPDSQSYICFDQGLGVMCFIYLVYWVYRVFRKERLKHFIFTAGVEYFRFYANNGSCDSCVELNETETLY